ncbi:hypothetical protein Rt10032_c17g5803 [Rhodotorula toruloides]|uniref:Uncharacterized protein n=1 Tax=Rhodotorula toruloides TaxID=5286 RepID=A0A511KPJ8_RHOTO|nr:hypothetical protein Rt10032_c17g5803 [Rhodotorula toruloides]
MADCARETHLRHLLAPYQLHNAYHDTWDSRFNEERPNLAALVEEFDTARRKDRKKMNSDLYSMLVSLMKLLGVHNVEWVWPFWRHEDLEQRKKGLQRELSTTAPHSFVAQPLPYLCPNSPLITGQAHTVLISIQQNVHHAFDTRYVVQKLRAPVLFVSMNEFEQV